MRREEEMTVSTDFSDEYEEDGTKVDKDKALLMPCYVEEKDEKVGQQLWEEDQTAWAVGNGHEGGRIVLLLIACTCNLF